MKHPNDEMCIKFGLDWLGRTCGARACSEKETAREQRDVALERKGSVRGVQNERVAEEMAMAGSSMASRTIAELVRPKSPASWQLSDPAHCTHDQVSPAYFLSLLLALPCWRRPTVVSEMGQSWVVSYKSFMMLLTRSLSGV
jgi:hypothetical protein